MLHCKMLSFYGFVCNICYELVMRITMRGTAKVGGQRNSWYGMACPEVAMIDYILGLFAKFDVWTQLLGKVVYIYVS